MRFFGRRALGNLLRCSFCGKSEHDVRKLIAGGGNTVLICDECVEICVDIIRDSNGTEQPRHPG